MARALCVIFKRPEGKEKMTGPFERVLVEGEVMKSSHGGNKIAEHAGHAWQVDGEAYTRADCSCPCMLHLRRAEGTHSKSYGPYESISFVDGIAYADRAVFAFADRSIGDWYCHEDGRHYPVLIIEPAG